MIRPAAPSARLAGGGILPSRSANPTIVASINPHLRTPLGLFHQPVHAHVRVGKHSASAIAEAYARGRREIRATVGLPEGRQN